MVGEDNNEGAFSDDAKDIKGLVPRLCEGIFERIAALTDANTTFTVEASYVLLN
jgi:hypothetical protein